MDDLQIMPPTTMLKEVEKHPDVAKEGFEVFPDFLNSEKSS